MDQSRLMLYMRNPELLSDRTIDELKHVINDYPIFQTARMLYVKNLRNQGYTDYNKALREAAIHIGNRTKLFFLLNSRVLIKNDAEPSQLKAESEVFDLSQLTSATEYFEPDNTAANELDKLIRTNAASAAYSQPAPDDKTPKRQTAEQKHQAELLNRFTGFNRPPDDNPQEPYTPTVDYSAKASTMPTDLISDTLAQIYVRNGQYEKALLMYEKLSLKFPEKNSYFAARIKEIKTFINK